MKAYLSGGISGLAQSEYHNNFERGSELIKAKGWEVVNPLEVGACVDEDCWKRYAKSDKLPVPGGGSPVKEDGTTFLHHYACYMKYDILALLECDVIVMLPNWITSRGAGVERDVAIACGLDEYYIDTEYRRIY